MLAGKRIFLRRFQLTDAPVLLKWGQDEHYHKMAGFERYADLQQATEGARQYSKRENSFVICLQKSKQVIGLVELYERGMDERSGLLKTKEIGFLLDKNYEGRGYMTEALHLVIKMAFTKMKQVELWAGTFADNLRSQKLLKRLGFHYVYTTDYAQISHLFAYQEKYYLLKKADWLKIVANTKS